MNGIERESFPLLKPSGELSESIKDERKIVSRKKNLKGISKKGRGGH